LTRARSLGDLADHVGGRVVGDRDRPIRGVATLDLAGPEELSFLTNVKYRKLAAESRAGAILVAPGAGLEETRDLLEVEQPYLALAGILELFHPAPPRPVGISPDARLADDAQIGREVAVGPFTVVGSGCSLGDRAVIGAGCVLGDGATVGEESELKPRVVLYPQTRVGDRCLIHAGVVLGADGFGFATTSEGHRKVPQLGRVVIEDEVEIGANTTIDRGTLGETGIGEGSKIDNLVMIAHGVRVGAGSLLAAQTGIAGSTRLGARTVWAGQSGAAGHLDVADGTVVAAKSAVLQSVVKGAFLAGIPAVDHRQWKRAQAAARKLPELRRQLRELKARVESLERDRKDG